MSRAVIHLEDGGERNKYSLLVEGDNLRLDTYSITSGFFGIILGNYVILDWLIITITIQINRQQL